MSDESNDKTGTTPFTTPQIQALEAELARSGHALVPAADVRHRFADGSELSLPAERGAQYAVLSAAYGRPVADRWRDLLDALDTKYAFELPPSLVHQEFAAVWAQVEQDLDLTGIELDATFDLSPDSDPSTVWQLRDYLARSLEQSGGTPQPYSHLTEEKRRRRP